MTLCTQTTVQVQLEDRTDLTAGDMYITLYY